MMDLRFRLNLVIALMMLVIATAGIVFSVISARSSVKKEVDTSIKTFTIMLDIGLAELDKKANPKTYLTHLINQLEQQRHLSIDLQPNLIPTNTTITVDQSNQSVTVPSWFVRLVRPEPQHQTRIITIQNQIYQLILHDNPGDEINEAWGEAQGLFYLLALQSLLVWGLCHFILGQALKPLPTLLSGLQRIESGDYTIRLTEFSLPEYKQITDTFNHAMASLHIKTVENHLLTQHSLNLQEQERQTLARELHDELAQSLTGIKGVASSIQISSPQSKQAVDTILSICDGLFLVVRSMMRRLRPSSLDEFGLAASLQELVNDWRQINLDCQIFLDVRLKQAVQNEQVTIHLYRIVQESLNNISRHAQASQVHINLQATTENSLQLMISDNGVGFDDKNRPQGFGLLGIRERIESLNGRLHINSQSGHGTKLTIIVPPQS
jgi:two-component system sensor histidine kinase UhpB